MSCNPALPVPEMADPTAPGSDDTTHFGFQQVPRKDKGRKVAAVFDSVADKYDLMNDLMSLGIHRIWKRLTAELSGIRPGQRVLDIAGGTGDLAARFARRVGRDGTVVLADINASMLSVGRSRLIDRGLVGNIAYVQADAERLPFAANTFDCITIGFGLRNVTDKDRALASMHQALRPGGRLLVLEFSHPTLPALNALYDVYSFSVLPWLGQLVAEPR